MEKLIKYKRLYELYGMNQRQVCTMGKPVKKSQNFAHLLYGRPLFSGEGVQVIEFPDFCRNLVTIARLILRPEWYSIRAVGNTGRAHSGINLR